MNPLWAGLGQGSEQSNSPDDALQTGTKRQRVQSQESLAPWSMSNSPDFMTLLSSSSSVESPFDGITPQDFAADTSTSASNLYPTEPTPSTSNFGNWDFILADNQLPQQQTELDFSTFTTAGDSGSNRLSFDTQSSLLDSLTAFSAQTDSASPTAPSGLKKRKSHQKDRALSQDNSITLLSQFGAAHAAMVNSNRNLISESLIRIYHDVLENNLACWLAEDTCPYRMEKRRQQDLPLQKVSAGETKPEWGADWSNRMYRRVKRLDRVAQATKLIRLSCLENRAVSKALDLVVIAFATQWAQGKRRTEKLDPDDWGNTDDESEFGDEFERNLQYSVWEQARKALQDVADLECFRVVYAELVFGLIQKPWIAEEYDLTPMDEHQDMKSAILSQVTEIIAQGGPPIFLEKGTRMIHALKAQFEAQTAAARRNCIRKVNGQGQPLNKFTLEDTKTVGLLYWMAVMFDTVSSSMNERPVVVGDDECEHDDSLGKLRDEGETPILNRKWKLDLYAQDDPEKPTQLHWPCAYEDATRSVARSAAVKVLLFRYISYLQIAIRKNEHGQPLEDIIQATTVVYRYWNKTHGALFRDLTKNFDTLPARIKSWFPCIAIPWHLGSLMFADVIDFVDENHLGVERARAERTATNMALRIRRSSATELADLAVVAAPQDTNACSEEQLQNFHFAVSNSPLLTEPWTILLIRAFTKAAVFHLGEADDMHKHEKSVLGYESDEFLASVRRGKSCVKALWLLGSKAEMAKAIAKVLVRPLQSMTTELTTTC